jgi:hypothetical protein
MLLIVLSTAWRLQLFHITVVIAFMLGFISFVKAVKRKEDIGMSALIALVMGIGGSIISYIAFAIILMVPALLGFLS